MQWIDAVRGKHSIREVARRAEMSQGTLNRQINADALTFETVLAISRAYGIAPVAGLVASGLLSADDAGIPSKAIALQSASDDELIEEVARRIKDDDITAFDVTASSVWAADPTIEDDTFEHHPRDEGTKGAYGLAALEDDRPADEDHPA